MTTLVQPVETVAHRVLDVRAAEICDLPKMAEGARQFYASSRFLRKFEIERFCSVWKGFIEGGHGVIFAAFDEDGSPCGALGGLTYPDLYSEETHAMEFFWFMMPGYRGEGMKLLKMFEQWAKDRGCALVRMAHLSDSMPEKLERVYCRMGYTLVESQFQKEIS